jgi:molecular chaperone HtpG
LVDVEFEIFTDSNEQVLAWMWYGISKFEKQIPSINPMRGIRLRKGNIQIGNENTFSAHDFYDESRGCLYFVGEVFAVSSNLIPNARRDYFNLNNTCREFEHQLRPLFCDRFKKIYHYANDYKKALQKQQDLASAQAEYQSNVEKGRFLDADDKQKAEEIIDEKKKIAEKAAKQIETRNSKEQADDVLTKVYTALRSDYPVTPKVPTKSEDTPAAIAFSV